MYLALGSTPKMTAMDRNGPVQTTPTKGAGIMEARVLDEILKCSFFAKGEVGMGLPVMLWGPPSTAKTRRLAQLAADLGVYFKHLCPGQQGHAFFGVTPAIEQTSAGQRLGFPVHNFVDDINKYQGRALVFVDEITSLESRAIQPALMSIVHERTLGDFQFDYWTRVFAAGNPPDIAANGVGMAPPQANRFMHYDTVPPDAKDVHVARMERLTKSTWENPRGVYTREVQESRLKDTIGREKYVFQNWDDAYADNAAKVLAFLSSAGATVVDKAAKKTVRLGYSMPDKRSPDIGRAWPSPRTWDMVINALTISKIRKSSDEVKEIMVTASVGTVAATAFLNWLTTADIPDAEEWLMGNVTYQHRDERPDVTHALVTAAADIISRKCTEMVKSKEPTAIARAKHMVNMAHKLFLAVVNDGARELMIVPASYLIRAEHEMGSIATQSDAAVKGLRVWYNKTNTLAGV